jgi:uncharacterized protein (DUF2336 family)
MSPNAESLITQFGLALGRLSSADQLAIQSQMIDFFLAGRGYSERQLAVFIGVMCALIDGLDRRALLDLSDRLATLDTAPNDVVFRLSMNDDIAVAGPVLEKSNALTDENLVEIARSKGQDHMAAIAIRKQVSDLVTDVLIERGGPEIVRRAVANLGARLSELGFVRVIRGAKDDEALAAALGLRQDVPAELMPFLKLAAPGHSGGIAAIPQARGPRLSSGNKPAQRP